MSIATLLAVAALTSTAAAKPPYTATPGPARATATFSVAYSGSGSWHTTYHSTPPNPGGHSDDNHVRDSSTQRWSLTFRHPITVPTCAAAGAPAPDPCAALTGVSGGSGPTKVVGRIHHVHVDGLFRRDNRAVRCTVTDHVPAPVSQGATVTVSYDATAAAVDVSTANPIPRTLLLLPGSCPQQGDSLDLLLDNYFMPGFSFATGFGADRWFTSQTVAIPLAVLHGSSRIRIPLGPTAAGTPPRTCAVVHRSYEHCTTGGSWSGVLTLTAR